MNLERERESVREGITHTRRCVTKRYARAMLRLFRKMLRRYELPLPLVSLWACVCIYIIKYGKCDVSAEFSAELETPGIIIGDWYIFGRKISSLIVRFFFIWQSECSATRAECVFPDSGLDGFVIS